MNPEDFRKLFERKFGNKHGVQLKAATVLGIRQGNLSNYLRAVNGSVPDKYAEALAALPDYCPPHGVTQEAHDMGVGYLHVETSFTTPLTSEAAKNLEIAIRFATKDHEHMNLANAPKETVAKFFEMIIHDYVITLREGNPSAFRRTMDKMKQDSEEAGKQFRAELQSRKHLVADELTENEIKNQDDDEDPLA